MTGRVTMTMKRFGRAGSLEVWLAALSLSYLAGCTSGRTDMDPERLREFAAQYTAAWSSQDAARVASFYSVSGSLKINDGFDP